MGDPGLGNLLLLRAALVVLATFIATGPLVAASSAEGTFLYQNPTWRRSTESWALGLVVPEGAGLGGGAHLSWSSSANLTAVVRLPYITRTDGVTYLILSAEGDNGAVMQVAAGIWPGSGDWSTYAWYITGLGTRSLSYGWSANCSAPSMMPGDTVSLSLRVGAGAWGISVRDMNSTDGRVWTVPSQGLSRFMIGDQEVIALESYTNGASTFEHMGNATLSGLYLDGIRVTSGWYVYGGWNAIATPLFAVGSAEPPTFVSLALPGDGRAVWYYDAQWTGAIWNINASPTVFLYACLAAPVPVAFLLGRRGGRGKEGGR
jgi:hypothetical protein